MNESERELGPSIPTSLTAAVNRLQTLYYDRKADLETWARMPEQRALAEAHHGIGQTIRNEWGLWEGSALREDLKAMGLFHADDMSSVILTCLHRTLNEKALDIEGQVQRYQDYWAHMPELDERSMEMTNAVGETFKVTTYVPKKKSRFDIAKE